MKRLQDNRSLNTQTDTYKYSKHTEQDENKKERIEEAPRQKCAGSTEDKSRRRAKAQKTSVEKRRACEYMIVRVGMMMMMGWDVGCE